MTAPSEPQASPATPVAAVQAPLRLLVALALLWFLPALLLSVAHLAGAFDWPPPPSWLWLATALGGVAMLAFAVRFPPTVAWGRARLVRTVGCYLPFAAAWVSFVVGYLAAMRGLGQPVPPQPALDQLAQQGLTAATLPTVLGAVVLAPVVEEVLFRGYLLDVLLRVLRPWFAQLLTAAAFGAVHGLGYALPLAVLGLFFGWLRQRTAALWPSAVAHALHNGLVVAVAIAWPASLDLLYPR